MSGLPRNYQNIEEFEREEIRPSFRIGFSIDDFEESSFEGEVSAAAERDEFRLDSLEADDEEDDEDEEEDEGFVD